MKQFILAGVGTALAASALIVAAPPASAGCQHGGITVSKCDGPVQPDGTSRRSTSTTSSYRLRRTAIGSSNSDEPMAASA